MDYKDIIDSGKLIYASRTIDSNFREWRLVRSICNIKYYSTCPLTKLDMVILLTLEQNGRLYENALAKILGFNVENDFDVTPKRYADKGEEGIFQGLLLEVASFGLLDRNEKQVSLSHIGKLALKKGVKYIFYEGAIALMESFDIEPKDGIKYKMFPFRDELGVITNIQCIRKLDYNSFNYAELENDIYGNLPELESQLNLQCFNDIRIFKAEKTPCSRMGEIFIDFRLYELNGDKYPLIFHNDNLSLIANDLLFLGNNKKYINNKIHIGEYLYLVRESNNLLNYDLMIPYEDVWNLDDFLDNSRIDWNDNRFFDEIAQKANGSHWNIISSVCPTESLKQYLQKYKYSFDWIVLSTRYDDNFIVDNATLYPWDFELLSSERNVDFIKRIIVIPELHKDIDWEWKTILSKLDDNFIIENISNIPFDMYSLSHRYLISYPEIIANYPERRWDWNTISTEANLDYILENIVSFSDYLQFEIIMSRAFVSEKYSELYCDSDEFIFAINKKKGWLQNVYDANHAGYLWSIKLIDWHEQLGFINWKSENNIDGFECNNNILWNAEVFGKYSDRPFSIKGLNHISKSITENILIDEYPKFKWIWNVLSSRDIVTSDLEFMERHIADISFATAIPFIDKSNLASLYVRSDFKQRVTEQDAWDKLTYYIEKNTILNNINDPNWDWQVITKNFCATLNFKVLDRLNAIDKLDWEYIAKNAEVEKIKENLFDYADKWDWNIITRRFDHDFIIDNLQKYCQNWDWHFIITDVLTREELLDVEFCMKIATVISQFTEVEERNKLWSELTLRYSTEDIFNIIRENSDCTTVKYEWNYSDVYNRPDFDINRLLEDSYIDDLIDWDVLSCSKALNRILKWDRKNIKEFHIWEKFVLEILSKKSYKWNFKYLSTLESINWCENILSVKRDEWDWSYLSENSKYFSYNPKRPDDIVKRIQKFARNIDFGILSKREDMRLSSEMLTSFINYDWNWNIISSNRGFKLSSNFIQEHKNLSWDWYVLSSRGECKFSSQFILENHYLNWNWQYLSKRKDILFTAENIINLIDKDWDWIELLKRSDLEFCEDMLPQLLEKNIDWKIFSRRNDFIPTARTLNLLNEKNLDWDNISNRKDLQYEVIEKFRDKLNWSILTKNCRVDLSKTKVLDMFRDYLDWSYVSLAKEFVPSLENLQQFKNKVEWSIICNRMDLVIDEKFMDAFKDYIDWTTISNNGSISFNEKLIERYRNKWDWVALSENPAFRLPGVESIYKKELNLVEFYNGLKKYKGESPYVYHFTHMFNAVEVIKTRKILSRDRAMELGLLKYDAAGTVVYRSAKAHKYARFYYRTGTQTQFYNECLGRQRYDKYYSNAESNGLPMCPMPVFFKFNLQEVLMKHAGRCYYSTGNLQTNWAQVYRIIDNPNNIDCKNLYSRNDYDRTVRDKKQQEFLVENEFDFSELKDYQIICYDKEETEILKTIFKNDTICEHICCVKDYDCENVYQCDNPSLHFEFSTNNIKISTKYSGDYIFQVESPNINKIRVNNLPSDIKAIKSQIIQLRNCVSLEFGNVPFNIYYVNLNPNARSPRWLVYQYEPNENNNEITESNIIENFLGISLDDDSYSVEELITSLELVMPRLGKLYNERVRHYFIKEHTLLVCKQFEKYAFDLDTDYINIDLMRIILAIHDVGKAIDRSKQHEHTLDIVREFWELTPFTEYELKLAEVLLKNDNISMYIQNQYDIEKLKSEIINDAKELKIPSRVLLQYKMILYQCDVASYTKDAGGFPYLEKLFEYDGLNQKIFDYNERLLKMSPQYYQKYNELKSQIYDSKY